MTVLIGFSLTGWFSRFSRFTSLTPSFNRKNTRKLTFLWSDLFQSIGRQIRGSKYVRKGIWARGDYGPPGTERVGDDFLGHQVIEIELSRVGGDKHTQGLFHDENDGGFGQKG